LLLAEDQRALGRCRDNEATTVALDPQGLGTRRRREPIPDARRQSVAEAAAEPGPKDPLGRGRRVLDDLAAAEEDEAPRVSCFGGIDRCLKSREAAAVSRLPSEGSDVRPERVAEEPVACCEIAFVPVQKKRAGGKVVGPPSDVEAVDDLEEFRPRS
jgi:hypothetical protein